VESDHLPLGDLCLLYTDSFLTCLFEHWVVDHPSYVRLKVDLEVVCPELLLATKLVDLEVAQHPLCFWQWILLLQVVILLKDLNLELEESVSNIKV